MTGEGVNRQRKYDTATFGEVVSASDLRVRRVFFAPGDSPAGSRPPGART